MYKLRRGDRVQVYARDWCSDVHESFAGRLGVVVGYTAGGYSAGNECYDVRLDGETCLRCFCFADLRWSEARLA
jgi:hypothetical protein